MGQQCCPCCTSHLRPFFKAQFHFKTQKQRFSDDLKVKSAAAGGDDDHAVCVDELVISENFVNRLFTFCELFVYKKKSAVYK